MSESLEALERAVIARPEDRALRGEFAAALAGSANPVEAARAEFIQTQLALENHPPHDARKIDLIARRDALFNEHWLDWWRSLCEPGGLPLPHVADSAEPSPGSRPANWPYTHSILPPIDRIHSGTLIHAADYKLSVRYAGGFPEEVRLASFDTPADAPALVHRWGDALPLHRLVLGTTVHAHEWAAVDGPHLARLPELIVGRLTAETAAVMARSEHLGALNRLSFHPHSFEKSVLQPLVDGPAWTGLRVLHVTGIASPEAVRALARHCTLTHLDDLELTLGAHQPPPEPPPRRRSRLAALYPDAPVETTPAPIAPSHPPWTLAEHGPALRDLAGAAWLPRLRRLTLKAAFKGIQKIVQQALETESREVIDVIPDRDILALAEAINPETLESLVVSSNLISPAAQHALVGRFGTRLTSA